MVGPRDELGELLIEKLPPLPMVVARLPGPAAAYAAPASAMRERGPARRLPRHAVPPSDR
jgi:hypothetical protein